MGEKVVIGPINKGLRNDREPFMIDNDSFPYLENAIQWRGRIKRKRGTRFLTRLERYFNSGSTTITLSSGSGNLITGFSLQANGSIMPGTVSITDTVSMTTYTDTNNTGVSITGITKANPAVVSAITNFSMGDKVYIMGAGGMTEINNGLENPEPYTITAVSGTTVTIAVDSTNFHAYTSGGTIQDLTPYLQPSGSATTQSGTINYSTGAFTITGAASHTVTAIFYYYPNLPVMGLEDLLLNPLAFPETLAFDTTYSYEINTSAPYDAYDVSFYKNPPATPPTNYTAYTPKTIWTPLTWSGQNYQQFWSTNYQGSFWVTNGNPGMQFNTISTTTVTQASSPAIVSIAFNSPSALVVGDFLFINEVASTTGINFQTGYVTTVTDSSTVVVTFPNAIIATNGTGGIAQYLTNIAPNGSTKDGIRWFDGDPTNGGTYPPASATGWVNFAPPLLSGPTTTFYIGDNTPGQYYLVGAKMIYPLRGFLIFFGPYIQTSTGPPIYLQDTIIYSQNGTPYYTCSFSTTTAYGKTFPISQTLNNLIPILTPLNQNTTTLTVQSAVSSSFFEDVTGFGGYISSGVAQPITTLVPNEDVLILGYTNAFTRLIYTGNNLTPFLFYRINTELGAGSTFSAITFDRGSVTIGSYGLALCTQVSAARIDLEIPDQVFQINYTNNGNFRVTAGRDFINEWVYFTYQDTDSSTATFPNQSLFYNYRDQSWSLIDECYTTYGQIRLVTGYTWANPPAATWEEWTEPWGSGTSTLLQQQLIAGNQQGFIMLRNNTTNEDPSEYIQNISGSTVTSPDHCLNTGDFIYIQNCYGSIGASVNNQIFQVRTIISSSQFTIFNPNIPITGTYAGNGVFTRMYVPLIQSKQFPVSWGYQRKTRIGAQMYLFTATDNGQITVQIYLSENSLGPTLEAPNDPTFNNAMIYSTILYTCPEGTNIGLTPENINLQQLGSGGSQQIWHRFNPSLIGDTIQIGFTLSEDQMFDPTFSNQFAEIEFHSAVIDVNPSSYLA